MWFSALLSWAFFSDCCKNKENNIWIPREEGGLGWIPTQALTYLYCCCCSVTQSCPTLCNPMDCSKPALPVPHHLPEFAQVHLQVHWWCHPAISSSDALFSFCPQSFPASETFPMSQLFPSDDQNTRASASASQFEGINFLPSAFFTVWLSKLYLNTGKTIALTIRTFVSRVMSLLFKTLSKFVIAFLPRSNYLLISWLQSPQWFWSPKKEICHYFHLFPFYLPWHNGAGCHDLSFLIFSFELALSLSSLTLIKRLFSSSSFLPWEWYHLRIWGCCFPHLSWFQHLTHPARHFSWCAQHIG